MENQTGILLINLGTPDNTDVKSVRRYLKQFLNDPRVVDLPSIPRWLLVNCIIIPLRATKTAAAYQKIWQEAGSPLLTHSEAIKEALANELGADYQVELGMRYGNPSIPVALEKLKSCTRLIILPLFPQYASAASGSAIECVLQNIQNQWDIPHIEIKKDFHNDPGFIDAYASVINDAIQGKKIDKLLFSFHGLPERHIQKSQKGFCYKEQSYETARLLANALELEEQQFTVCFQSRLGVTPWIKPYTDRLLPQLIRQGVKSIAVVCPSFVADCLETLEEVNIRTREQWRKLGGAEFTFIPCLNDNPLWIQALRGLT